jgi:arylsulfatase A-like enzyme
MIDMTSPERPNIIYFQVDNLGFGELGCYGGGVLRGARTPRIDSFAQEGFQLLNFAPECQCSPSRSALLTGRHAIRSGNQTAKGSGAESGLVSWEQTFGDLFSDAGYATMCMGKWHVGDGDGRWPTDHGFDEWYGPVHSYDEALWERDPWYVPGRDPVSHMREGIKGQPVREAEQLTYELKRNIDVEYLRRSLEFIDSNVRNERPFCLYFNHSLMHIPVVPRDEFKDKSGNGDWADSLLQLDADFGALLDHLEALGVAENTIVVFAGDNGNEEMLLNRGTGGFWEGSYFTGMEASLRTPCIARWPGRIESGVQSNEIVHVTDMFSTLLSMAGVQIPEDRVIDGKDQSSFLFGQQEHSNREGFLYWNGPQLYGIKWQNFKLVFIKQKYMTDPAVALSSPHIVNLITDPKEREPVNPVHLHTWTMAHFSRLITEFEESVRKEPLIPLGAALDYVPRSGL